MPDWLFPHRGYPWERIVSQTFLHSQGVFGIALKVMFTYVFLFVLFGALLEKTGATGYIINFAKRLFRSSIGGPAKVAVVSSGAMGSLSGSAVANTATTGIFTIPMMRASGFKPTVAGGIEAAASSGGALVPPIMGAGAYMMLEIVEPAVTYLEIIKAALIPAVLYYTALLLIVHFYANRVGALSEVPKESATETSQSATGMEGFVFLVAFITLILFLLLGYTPFRAVSLSLLFILILIGIRGIWDIFRQVTHSNDWSVGSLIRHTFLLLTRQIWIGIRRIFEAMEKATHGGVSLIAAAACVGLILGVVTLTGIGAKLPGTPFTACREQSHPSACLLDGFNNYPWDGLTFISVLPSHGDVGWAGIERIGIGSPCRPSLYFLFWYDGDGDAAGRFGRIYSRGHCRHRYHADGGCCLSLRVGGVCAALRLCAEAGAITFVNRWRKCSLFRSCGKRPDRHPRNCRTSLRAFPVIGSPQLDFWKRAGLLAAAAVCFLTHFGWGQFVAFIVVAAIGVFNWRSKIAVLGDR